MAFMFEWDERKARINEAKHGIRFEEARTIFNDPFSITIKDSEHSVDEERWLDIGLSVEGRLMVVWYTERDGRVRIIGCRDATRIEERTYSRERS